MNLYNSVSKKQLLQSFRHDDKRFRSDEDLVLIIDTLLSEILSALIIEQKFRFSSRRK